ncbi:tetratricopeptide repeat protein [Lentisphaera profundi]|uniref:Tetratricopeptide repeat protein n=1 Tax=Lentisphaera profundi TaxID=1658616 RepID=A0ABY7VWU5_9BACT|nr:tetratricopeptide repeat protein [Lentisphaera profundi]WDE98567.1 tetratricopeptide repeat protein [Lentisphaera profundi]
MLNILSYTRRGNSEVCDQFNLGLMFENGRGTKVDFAKANEWYRKASVQGDAWAIGNLGMLYIRGDGVKENKIAGLALLLQSVTLDSSPQNQAKTNISTTRGLSVDMIKGAQALSDEFSEAKNLLVPLDKYLQQSIKSPKK